jgi:formylglycine-generating enzyme required for sulfatase activity
MKKLFFFLLLAAVATAAVPPRKKKLKLPEAYVFVPSGTITENGEKKAVQGFYMQKSEVTNLHYREFLTWLKHYGTPEDLAKAQLKPEGWRTAYAYNEPFVENYHTHPAFENYPVVNVSYEAAQLYCQWLTGILQDRHPDYTVEVRLPTETEWKYAAAGGKDGWPYPNGYYLRDAKGKILYTYRQLGDEAMTRDPETGAIKVVETFRPGFTGAPVGPAPAESGYPNDFGLYNTSGNVAEMLAEPGKHKGGCFNSTGYDIRIDAPDEFAGVTEASPFVGFRVVVVVKG